VAALSGPPSDSLHFRGPRHLAGAGSVTPDLRPAAGPAPLRPAQRPVLNCGGPGAGSQPPPPALARPDCPLHVPGLPALPLDSTV
jgi:hypothetical protein